MDLHQIPNKFKIAFFFYKRLENQTQKEIIKILVEKANKSGKGNFSLSSSAVSQFLRHNDGIGVNKLVRAKKILEELIGAKGKTKILEDYYNNETQAFRELGISVNESDIQILNNLDIEDLKKAIENETKEIKIISSWLMDVRGHLIEVFEKAISNNVKIKILLLHPNGSMIKLRSKGIGEKDKYYGRRKVIENLEHLSTIPNISERIEIRLYHQIPAIYSYLFSDKVLSGWFFINKLVQKNATLKVEGTTKTQPFYKAVLKHFNDLWGYHDTEAVDLDNLEELKKRWDHDLKFNELLDPIREMPFLEEYEGVWGLYYLENKTDEDKLKKNRYISAIGYNILIIEKSPKSDSLRCRMRFYYNHPIEYYGLVNIGLKKNRHISLTLFDPDEDRVLNLLFNIDGNFSDIMFGAFNVIYKRDANIGSGLVVLHKCPSQKENENQPCSINPVSNENMHLIRDSRILNYLIFRKRSLFIPIKSKEELKNYEDCPYKGFYNVYAYGRLGNEPCISISLLEITSYHYATFHKWKTDKKGIAYGFVNKITKNLRINLENEKQERQGTITIYVGNIVPEVNTIFAGTFSGISFQDDLPVCSLVILKYYGESSSDCEKPNKISFFNPDYLKIDKNIKGALSGRENRFIKFRNGANLFRLDNLEKENKDNIDYGYLFYQSALMYAKDSNGKVDLVVKMILRAIYHGLPFDTVVKFEEQIKGSSVGNAVIENANYKMLREKVQNRDQQCM